MLTIHTIIATEATADTKDSVATRATRRAFMAPGSRAAALAIGYGAAQTVAAILLTIRVHGLTGAMNARRVARMATESFVSAVASVAMMVWMVSNFDPTRRQALVAFLLGGTAGVAVFACSMTLFRSRELLARRGRQLG